MHKAERKFGLVIAFSVTEWYDEFISKEDSGCRNLHESRGWVKGKQVRILRDLVTVSKEHRICIVPLVFLEDREGDRMCGYTSQETCRLLVQEQMLQVQSAWHVYARQQCRRQRIPDHEGLVVP